MRYQLIDFGNGRKLERFGEWTTDRPSPAADGVSRRRPKAWSQPDATFRSEDHCWSFQDESASESRAGTVEFDILTMPVSPTPFGHVGVFPEQLPNWRWLSHPPESLSLSDERPLGLNLFAYTGASTIALAKAGFQVAHVDAAKPNVQAAQLAARANGLEEHPIRYLVDDARKFVRRELRREKRYHTIVLDPPAYGHSPKGQAWRIERDLRLLLDDCCRLLNPDSFRLLVTGHSSRMQESEVIDYLTESMKTSLGYSSRRTCNGIEAGRLSLTDLDDRRLDAGFFVRFQQDE
ncbi:MAG: SAM-dependent methyltransferase [Planctomycetota bacterium]